MEPPSTLREYVESQDRLDREARELFPFDFSTCSFDQGYVKQQIFACRTCDPIGEVHGGGGVCYSCSITCHGEHELIELFNRRAFRCDCGTDRAGLQSCCIDRVRRPLNHANIYNDNFKNIFCYCKRYYDAENEEGTMYQCLLCEDWFHDRCIELSEVLPNSEAFEHYLCRDCVDRESWLRRYSNVVGFCAQSEPKPVSQSSWAANSDKRKRTPDRDTDVRQMVNKKINLAPRDESGNRKVPFDKDTLPCHVTECLWNHLPERNATRQSLFLTENFRDCFCSCDDCTERLKLLPAIATEEEVYDPPEDDQDDNESTFEAGSRALESTLQSMPRDKAIDGLLAYNKLKDHITACLKPLADRGEIVTSDHVREFFQKRA